MQKNGAIANSLLRKQVALAGKACFIPEILRFSEKYTISSIIRLCSMRADFVPYVERIAKIR